MTTHEMDYLGISYLEFFTYKGTSSLYLGEIYDYSNSANASLFIKRFNYAPPYAVIVKLEDYQEWLPKLGVGDIVTLNEPDMGLTGKFRVLKREFIFTEDEVCVKFTLGQTLRQLGVLSAADIALTKDIASVSRTLERSIRFPVGSTAAYSVHYEDNAQAGTSEPYPVTCYFSISEYFREYSVKLTYFNLKPRTWNTTTNNFVKTEHSYTTTDISLYAFDGNNWLDITSDIENAIGRQLKSGLGEYEIGLDISKYFSGSGLKGVRIVTNGNSRHQICLNIVGHVIY